MNGCALHIRIIDANRILPSIIEEGLKEAWQARVAVMDDAKGLMRSAAFAASRACAQELDRA